MAHSGGKESGLFCSVTQGGEVPHISLLITEGRREVERWGERGRRDSGRDCHKQEGTDRCGEHAVKVKQAQGYGY